MLRVFIFLDIHKKKEGVRAIRAIKYKQKKAGKYTRARAPWRDSAQIEYSSQKMAQPVRK